MRFTLKQIQYFVSAGETLSVTRAAEQLSISQPSVSAAIAHLESELRVQLFVRHHAQGLTLTSAGKTLLRAARETLRAAGEIYDVARDIRDRVEGTLHVGTFFTLAPLIAPELWAGFSRRHERVQMTMSEGSAPDLIEALRQARIELALTWGMDISSDITFTEIARMHACAIVPPTHRFAQRETVDLAEDPLVLVDIPGTKEYFLRLFSNLGITPRIVTKTVSTATLRSYVAAGIGYGVTATRPRNQIAENGLPLTYLPLADVTEDVAFGIARLTDLNPSRVVSAFIDHCFEVMGAGELPGTFSTSAGPRTEDRKS